MAFSKGDYIIASEVNAYNSVLLTDQFGFEERNREDIVVRSFAPRGTLDYNLTVKLRSTSGSASQCDVEVWDETGTTQYLEWDNGDESPSFNSPGWDYLFDGNQEYSRLLLLPPGTWQIRLGTGGGIPKPEARARMYQAQSNIAQGKDVRVWDETWTALLPKGDTEVFASTANDGYVGTD